MTKLPPPNPEAHREGSYDQLHRLITTVTTTIPHPLRGCPKTNFNISRNSSSGASDAIKIKIKYKFECKQGLKIVELEVVRWLASRLGARLSRNHLR